MRIAAVQCLTVPDDLDHACDALACRLEWAGASGATLEICGAEVLMMAPGSTIRVMTCRVTDAHDRPRLGA
jgi:hypothetical protein